MVAAARWLPPAATNGRDADRSQWAALASMPLPSRMGHHDRSRPDGILFDPVGPLPSRIEHILEARGQRAAVGSVVPSTCPPPRLA